MSGTAARFFATAVAYAVLGMALGLVMGITKDHSQMPTHAHILVIGWVSFALFGFFYHLFPSVAASRLATVHFWLAQASFILLIGALYLLFSGHAGADPVAAAGSIGYLASMLVFVAVVLPIVSGRRA